jgi:hypothetical protein
VSDRGPYSNSFLSSPRRDREALGKEGEFERD